MNKFPYESLSREILLKDKSDPKGTFGKTPEERSAKELLHLGIINLDKPSGPTSHQVADFLKKILELKKVGHSGTLDPGVTGVLTIALGRSTKVIQALLTAGKEYVCLMHIHKLIDEKTIKKTINEFIGKITQMPPVKSAVKRQLRERTIYYIDLLEIDGQDVLFRVGSQAGTYIRKLCYDIGQKLGVGAHMAELRRTRVADFNEDSVFTLREVQDAYHYYKKGNEKFLKKMITPIEKAVSHLPKIWVQDSAVKSLSHGRDLAVPGIAKVEKCVEFDKPAAVLTLKGELIGFGIALLSGEEIINAEKGLVVELHKVLISEV